jgi:hypothetical protein
MLWGGCFRHVLQFRNFTKHVDESIYYESQCYSQWISTVYNFYQYMGKFKRRVKICLFKFRNGYVVDDEGKR